MLWNITHHLRFPDCTQFEALDKIRHVNKYFIMKIHFSHISEVNKAIRTKFGTSVTIK